MTLEDMAAELQGQIPDLSYFLSKRFIQRAWRDICQRREWSFRQVEGLISTPLIINAGAIAVTAFSQTAVADATAKAALDAVVSAHPPLVGRQFRVGSQPNGIIYTITDYDSTTGTLTLNNLFRGTTNAASTYQVYQCYYGPPLTLAQDELLVVGPPVHRWVSVEDPNQGYTFTQYHVPKATLDRTDPTRSSQGQPIWLCDCVASADGGTLYEMWPHPTQGQTFDVTYQVLYTRLEDPDDQIPDIVPESLVIDRAKAAYAYPWAMANASRFPQLKGVNWASLMVLSKKDYEDNLAKAKMEDDGRMLKTKLARRAGRRAWPLSASYIQTHDVNRLG